MIRASSGTQTHALMDAVLPQIVYMYVREYAAFKAYTHTSMDGQNTLKWVQKAQY